MKGSVLGGLFVWVRRLDLGELLADRAFLVNEAADLATEPDITFCSWEALRSGRVKYAERIEGSERFVEVIGSPDLVVEVVSDNSVRKDTRLLPKRYFRAGIPEYWLIDARGEKIDFKLLVRRETAYVEKRPDSKGYRRSQVFDRAFRITRARNPVGGYSYQLLDR